MKMKDSGVEWIGEIPEDWNRVSLMKVLRQAITDGPHETPAYLNEGIPFVSVDSLNETESIDLTNVRKFISEQDYETYNKKTSLTDGDILFTKSATIGKTAIVNTKDKYMVWSPLAVIKPNYDMIDNKYLYYLFNSDKYIEHVTLLGTSNTQVNVGMRTLEKSMIVLPNSIEIQKKIATYLDEKVAHIDNIIEKTKESIEEYKKYKQSLITEAVTKGLNPEVKMKDSGIEWIGEVPEHWGIIAVGKLFDFIGGYAFNSDDFVNDETNNQVIRIGNIKNDNLILEDKQVFVSNEIANRASKFIVLQEDILFSMTGTKGKRDYFYTVRFVNNEQRNILNNQRVGCLRAKIKLSAQYYSYLLKVDKILDSIFLYETGTANQGNLGIETIRRTILHFPDFEEQTRIVEFLDVKCIAIENSLKHKSVLIDELESYKKSLIYEVVTGKKEIN